jgi:glycosyltransferase involved in cell wall biosynthesis
MRVLHVYSGNLFGGVESLLVTLARARSLCPGLDQAFALCFEGRLSRELTATGVVLHQLGPVRASRPLAVWRARRRLVRLLDEQPADIVLAHSTWPLAIFGPALAAAGVPVAVWLHNPPDPALWADRRAAAAAPALVIANSRFTAAAAGRLFSDVEVACVHPPFACGGSGADRAAVRAALDTPEHDVVILQASRMETWKGHAEHLAALARLAHVPGWTAWFAGGSQRPHEAAYRAALERQAAGAGLASRVRFLGERDDVAALMGAADIYCQPNREPEPFGLAFVEALCAGLPVVATDMGGVTEIVDASCGVLVKPGDEAALAEALGGLMGDAARRARLGGQGPARARAVADPATQMARLRDRLAAVANTAGAA